MNRVSHDLAYQRRLAIDERARANEGRHQWLGQYQIGRRRLGKSTLLKVPM